MGGWIGGWMEVKAVLRIAYSNKKSYLLSLKLALYFENTSHSF
jgi:hypothetical protein